MYFLDWDLSGRIQTVEILDAGSGAVLNTQTLSDFGSGKYLVWDLKGNVRVRLTKVSGFNAVLSGLFFGPAGSTGGGSIQQTTSAILNQSKLKVRITGAPGQAFKIYSSTNLTSWTEVTTVTLTGTTYDYADAGGGTGKFYKAIPQ